MPCATSVRALGIAAGASLVVGFSRASGRSGCSFEWLSLAGLAIALYPVACGLEIWITGKRRRCR